MRAKTPQVPSIPPRSAVFRSVDLAEQFAPPLPEASPSPERTQGSARAFASEPTGSAVASDDNDSEVTHTGAPPSLMGALTAPTDVVSFDDDDIDLSVVDEAPDEPAVAPASSTIPAVPPQVAPAAMTEAEASAERSLSAALSTSADHDAGAASAPFSPPLPAYGSPAAVVAVPASVAAVPPPWSRRLAMFAAGATVGVLVSVGGLWAAGEWDRLRHALGL